MKSISLTPLILLLSLSTWVTGEPPSPNYVHSSYDDQTYHYEEPSHGSIGSPSIHSHSHSHGPHSSYGHGGPSEEPEIIVQHHHHPGPPRMVSHGHASEASHYPSSSSGPKPSSHRHAPPSYATRGHSPTHSYSPRYESSSHGHGHGHAPHYSSHPTKTAYSTPAKTEYSEGSGLNTGYSSYKQNDYKAYSSPNMYSDDYGIEPYGHGSEYAGGPSSSGSGSYTHSREPSYSKVESVHSYNNPPGSSYSSPGQSSYATTVYDEPATAAPAAPSYSSRPKTTKTYRAPSYSSYAGSPTSSFGSPSKVPSTSYSTISHSKGYGPAKSYLPKLLTTYGSSKPHAYAPPKSTYSTHKTPSSPHYSGSLKSYYRQPHSAGTDYTSSGMYPSTGYSPSSYAAGSPSYSYGSPSTKGFGYKYNSQYEKPLDKGYVRFTADDSYGGPGEHDSLDEISEAYGGGFDAGTSHY